MNAQGKARRFFCAGLMAGIIAPQCLFAESGHSRPYSRYTDKAFDDVVFDLEFAITQANYRLTARNRVGEAIAEMRESPYPKGTLLHFCNSQIAASVLDIKPDYLLNMPCKISVREVENGKRVVVETYLLGATDDPELAPILDSINATLREIVAFGAGE